MPSARTVNQLQSGNGVQTQGRIRSSLLRRKSGRASFDGRLAILVRFPCREGLVSVSRNVGKGSKPGRLMSQHAGQEQHQSKLLSPPQSSHSGIAPAGSCDLSLVT
jgi:hypothetical protein